MNAPRSIPDRAFDTRSTTKALFGAWSVISVLQIFLAEFVVSLAWAGRSAYSPIFNVISDLGAAHCGIYNGRSVCSPLNWVMNGSFVLQGLGMLLGGLLLSSTLLGVAAHFHGAEPPQLRAAHWVRGFLVVCGIGVMAVGIFPEDTIGPLHYLGAALFFVCGSIAQFLLWWIWYRRSWSSWILLLSGIVAVVATILFTVFSLWLDVPGFPGGLVERLIVYPVVIGFAVVGMTVARGVRAERKAQAAQASG
ncbi:DUF998 domain-containing protein [Arthrobacter russicus]|jgi:hypothetical membrane protein|uniref:Membrane protein n=1 Tax=Arthrobacter russicus TaxID=172040 RepID=A0ABU1J9Y2_9MICC|nr:DUF998 domain-containing protein [Arthrobacter russicus]MDN5667084.1 DUF998 domain-containing protein [Renibacterium salmoninarum]MDR6269231.1 putative membrane protein [Arthrobacter russicus]